MILAGIILFVVSIVANLAIDYKEILSKGRVNHKSKWPWIRKALISLPSVLLFAWELSDEVKWMWCLVFSSLMIAFVFYIIYDPLLNTIRGYGFFYGGTPDKYDSIPERILERPFKAWLTFTIKVLLAAASTYLYIEMI